MDHEFYSPLVDEFAAGVTIFQLLYEADPWCLLCDEDDEPEEYEEWQGMAHT